MNTIEEIKDLLCQAINSRSVIQFKYDGRSRIVEPYCCGVNNSGNYILRGFQIRGSDKTKPLCWRLYELSGMSQLNTTQHSFNGKRAEYQENDTAMTDILCCI